MTDLTKGQQKLADEVAVLLAESALPPDITTQILENLGNLNEPKLIELVRWLSDRTLAVGELETALVDLQKQHDAEWKSLEKEQQHIADALIEEEVAAATAKANIDALLAGTDKADK